MIRKLLVLKQRFFSFVSEINEPGIVSKQDQEVDNFSRLIASPFPRREMIKLLAVGLTTTLIGKLEFPAFASSALSLQSAAACCNGEQYDPSTQCCSSSGIQPKYPISDLAACPNRVAHPGHIPSHNGCGGGIFVYIIPNSYGEASFLGCCNDHDDNYDTCNYSKGTADQTFRSCLQLNCNVYAERDLRTYNTCLKVADNYYNAVSSGIGQYFYADAQKQACDCCGSSTPTPGQMPCNGTCVDTNTNSNNCGTCGKVCPQGQSCSNGVCCNSGGVGCGTFCCNAGDTCCGNNSCCPAGSTCCNYNGRSFCSAVGNICCGNGASCPSTQKCCVGADGTPTCNPPDSTCCIGPTGALGCRSPQTLCCPSTAGSTPARGNYVSCCFSGDICCAGFDFSTCIYQYPPNQSQFTNKCCHSSDGRAWVCNYNYNCGPTYNSCV